MAIPVKKSTNSPESLASLRSDLDARDPFVSWQIVDLQFPEEVDTDMVIPHNLRINHPRDVHYRVIKQFTRGTVYESAAADSKPWTSNYIVLRSDTPGWTGRLLLGVLKKVVEFPIEQFDIPENNCDPCNPDDGEVPEGEECRVFCSTVPQKAAPPAADGIVVAGAGSIWGNSDWVELEDETANPWIVTSVVYLAPASAKNSGNDFEIDIGVGPVGNETVVATVCGLMGSNTSTNADHINTIEFGIPAEIIPEGARVSMRLRQESTDTGEWRLSLTYYDSPLPEDEQFDVARTGPTCWPNNGAPVVIVPNTTPWANSNWTELTGSTGSEWFLYGLYVVGPAGPEWEIDVGVGPEGSEEVVTTLRGQTNFFLRDGAGYHNTFRPILDAIPKGSRVAVRQRKSDTSSSSTVVKAMFYRERVKSYTTAQPMKVWPPAQDSLAISYIGGEVSDWVEFEPFTSTPVAITGFQIDRPNGGSVVVEIGSGDLGEEESFYKVVVGQGVSTAGGWQRNVYLPIAKHLPAGSRIVARILPLAGSATRLLAIQYIENPDFTNVTKTDTYDVFSEINCSTPGVWANSGWNVVVDPVPQDIRLISFTPALAGDEECEFDIGVGLSGEEQVITTIRAAAGQTGTPSGARWMAFPVPHCVEAGQRLVVRGRSSGGGNPDIRLQYITNNGDELVPCGPEGPEGSDDGDSGGSGGSGSGIDGPNLTIDNSIARWDGVDGSALQGSGIIIADGASGTLSGSNSGDVTLSGTPDYITISGQVITLNQIDLSADVTNRLSSLSQLPSIPTDRILGRESSGSGDVETLALGFGLKLESGILKPSGAWVPLTDGDETDPQIIFAGGEVIVVFTEFD